MSATMFIAKTLFETRPGTSHDSWRKIERINGTARGFDRISFDAYSRRFH